MFSVSSLGSDPDRSVSSRFRLRTQLLGALGCRARLLLPAASLLALTVTCDPAAAQTCPSCVPLDDLSGPTYGGFPPGLYPGPSDTPPAVHLALALEAANGIVPRDALGLPHPGGLIGLISIGMSNTNQEFAAFEYLEDARPGRNPHLVLIDCAVGGKSAELIVDPADDYWTTVDARILAAGLSAEQIQVVWLKEAEGTVVDTSFPTHALLLQTHLRGIVQQLKDRFPNLQLCYLSSRIYGGYGVNPARTEPLSYETGFSVRWVIEDQIAGDPALNADPDLGPVEAPVLLWGPYLWANGTTPRASDGLVWDPSDYEGDFVHPSALGEAKVANLLEDFLVSDPTAASWRTATGSEAPAIAVAFADAYVDDTRPQQNFGSEPVLIWSNPSLRSYLLFDLDSVEGTVFHAKLSLRVPPETVVQRADVGVVTNTTWDETTLTAANAPPMNGGFLGTIPGASRGTALSLDVTEAVQTALESGPGAKLSIGIRITAGNSLSQEVGSRESVDPPRLVLSTDTGTTAVAPGTWPPVPRLRLDANPFTGSGTITLDLVGDVPRLEAAIYDAQGRAIRSLFTGPASRGAHALPWDGLDGGGRRVPGGIYFVRVVSRDPDGREGAEATAKVALIRP